MEHAHVTLVRTLNWNTNVLSLLRGELGQLSIDMLQVQRGDLLVENLGQNVDANWLLADAAELDVLLAELLILGLEEGNLSQNLVGEGAGHDEGRMTGSAAKVDEATLSEEDDVTAVRHQVTVNLRLDVLHRDGVGLEPGNINLDVKVADVWCR